jgi:thiosulfate/3-mercaptopyruvate sulfurtransferase
MVASMDLPTPLVGVEWLRDALESRFQRLVVFDVRWVPGGSARAAFQAGHISGAMLLDADADLAGRPFVDGPGRHPLPPPEVFAATMSLAGVGDGVGVVAYDDVGGSYAARLWWMLDAVGHRNVAVLDGGLAAWGGPLEVGNGYAFGQRDAAFDPGGSEPFPTRPWPRELIADADDVEAGLRAHRSVVLDARAPQRYRGEVEPIDPVAGHIPGAVSAPWATNLGADGRFLDAASLRAHYVAIGHGSGDVGVIAHCGSGLTACHDILALRIAGLGPARLYEGSWSDWVSDPRREVATGSDPGTLPRV